MNKKVKRELEVAFAKDAQPRWYRVVKYIVIAAIVYFCWGTKWLWMIFVSLVVVSVALHFWYRHKTEGWTRSYGLWKHPDDKSREGA